MVFDPRACVCYLEVGQAGTPQQAIPGSGWVVGAEKGLVCTSGHTLHPGNGFEPGWVRVWIGGQYRREGELREGTNVRVHPRWESSQDDACDLALVCVGDLSNYGSFSADDLAEPGLSVELTGFAADGPSDRRHLEGHLAGDHEGLVRYQLDAATRRGMSGSPVWTTRGGTTRPTVVAVHTEYKNGWSLGVRLTAEHLEWIKNYL